MNIVFLVFDRLTMLDAIGPYEVLSRLPGAQVQLVGKTRGLIRSDNKMLGLQADLALADVKHADILVVPGGFGTTDLAADPLVLQWLRELHATTTWTTSVCTGSLLLGAAGLLQGLQATTHWAYLDELAQYGATPVRQRSVWQGKIVTAAGVAAGIDMALSLCARVAGESVAQAIQLGIEYDPQPPFDVGSPEKAPPQLVAAIRERLAARRAAPAKV